MELAAERVDDARLERIFQKQQQKSQLLRMEAPMERKKRLGQLGDWIFSNRNRIKHAVHQDFKKPLLEVDTTEIYPVLTEIRFTLSHLDDWAKPTKVDAPLTFLGTRSEIRYEPKGVCLIIAPWNFPFNLSIGPLISCLASGNTAILKPSEMTPFTSQLVKEMMAEIFDEELVTVVEGGPEVSTCLLSLPFDHIFFTGSPAVGKVVMKAAAQHLASVTLELGGKSPTIVDETADLKMAAQTIAWGKYTNNGQTCIAPDHIYVHASVKDEFVRLFK